MCLSAVTVKKRVGIFSGSFNPIHNGHTELATFLSSSGFVDEVWMVVSPCNPLKKSSELIDEFLRLDMVVLAISGKESLKASDIEFTLPVPSYSIDTLQTLSNQFPDYEFVLIIGSDNALIFHQWKEYKRILENYPILVYPRKGFDFEKVAIIYPQMKLLQTPFYEISSTQIREMISQKKDVSDWIHPSVLQFIKDNNLYQY